MKYENMTYQEWKKTYKYASRHWPDVSRFFGYNSKNIEIVAHTVRAEKHGKKWVVIEDRTETVGAEYYMNVIDAVPFFRALGGREMVRKCYTKYGLIPWEIVSISPDRESKTVRTFEFL